MRNKRSELIRHLIGAGLFAFVGYILSAMIVPKENLIKLPERVHYVLTHLFSHNHWNNFSIWCVLAGVGLYFLTAIYLKTDKDKKFLPGEEYGSARFIRPQELNCKLSSGKEFADRIYSQNVRMSYDFKRLRLNGHTIVIGGSGTGKTFFLVTPNVMQMPQGVSFIFTDPKGGVLASTGNMLERAGWNVLSLNLIEPEKSHRFNPFNYLREDLDVIKFVDTIILNTTPPDAHKGDPFWENSERLLLKAFVYYVWMEHPVKNMGTVMSLLSKFKVTEDNTSEIDQIMDDLAAESELGELHPAVLAYRDCVNGAEDTVRSIVLSLKVRLAKLNNPKILRLLEEDDLDIPQIGAGVNYDEKTPTALFCIIPDADDSYNFIIGMFYSMLFQELIYTADWRFNKSLPLHVCIHMDEFANIALPKKFDNLLATIRSRNMSVWIYLQALSQLKKLYKDEHDSIVGNCDTLCYLGGNETESFKYMSERLGKRTIYKRNSSQNTGKQGGGSKSVDPLGRELLTPDEVSLIPNDEMLVIERGFRPVRDKKYSTFNHPRYSELFDDSDQDNPKNEYIFKPRLKGAYLINDVSVKNYDRWGLLEDLGDAELILYQEALKKAGKETEVLEFYTEKPKQATKKDISYQESIHEINELQDIDEMKGDDRLPIKMKEINENNLKKVTELYQEVSEKFIEASEKVSDKSFDTISSKMLDVTDKLAQIKKELQTKNVFDEIEQLNRDIISLLQQLEDVSDKYFLEQVD